MTEAILHLVQPAGENRSVAIPFCALMPDTGKYHRWYDGLMRRARERDIPPLYTEQHHILPRSMGGADDENNLARLTYREHFIAHWLLTKFSSGRSLHKMQRALFAMTLHANGTRIVAAWQFEVAKRAVKDLKISTRLRLAAEQAESLARRRLFEDSAMITAARQKELDRQAAEFLRGRAKPPVIINGRKSRRPRPSKRLRQHIRAQRELAAHQL